MGEQEVERLSAIPRSVLDRYLAELEAWNHRINLTAVSPRDTWRHVAESLRLETALELGADAAVVDVGSGAGFPGFVLACAAPTRRVVLLESDTRKAAFLTHAAGVCGLRRVEVVARRAEEAAHDPDLREAFDAAVSRAAAAPPALCELALPFVRVGGVLGAIVGAIDPAESLHAAAACGGGHPALIEPGVLRVPKTTPTPSRYPRRAGVPKRRPIMVPETSPRAR